MAEMKSAGARGPERRMALHFFGLILGCLVLVGLGNWVINPWGLYPLHLMVSRVGNQRYPKCALLRRCQPPPAQLVLGSSRSQCFEPRWLESRTGLRTFNLAVSGGRPEDFLALYRFATEEARAPVRSVVLGLEMTAFSGCEVNYPVLESDSTLRRFVPRRPVWVQGLSQLSLLLSRKQAEDAWVTLCHALGSGPAGYRPLQSDGYELPGVDRLRPNWTLAQKIHADLNITPGKTDPGAFRDLARLLSLLDRQGVQTRIVLMPMVEPLWQAWRRNGYGPQEERVHAQIRRLAARYHARFADFSHVQSFGGDPKEFRDCVHATVVNGQKMIDALFPPVRVRVQGSGLCVQAENLPAVARWRGWQSSTFCRGIQLVDRQVAHCRHQ
jgi:hypothetical protein